MRRPSLHTTALLVFWAACGGSTAPEPSEAPAAKATAPSGMGISADLLTASADDSTLVPSPMETQRALNSADLQIDLATLVQPHAFDLEQATTDRAAVRTGVILADLILTVKTAEKQDVLDRLAAIRQGMQQLEGGKDIDAVLRTTRDQVRDDMVPRGKLVADLDDLSGAVIPELEFNGQERVLPLIQAGSWLEGANLIARAVKAQGKPEAADDLLKQPSVVDYFIGYIHVEGIADAPDTVTETLEEALGTLKTLAQKPTPLTEEDIDTVIRVTSDVLALL